MPSTLSLYKANVSLVVVIELLLIMNVNANQVTMPLDQGLPKHAKNVLQDAKFVESRLEL